LLYTTIEIKETLFLIFTIDINNNNILIESNSNRSFFSRLKSRLKSSNREAIGL